MLKWFNFENFALTFTILLIIWAWISFFTVIFA